MGSMKPSRLSLRKKPARNANYTLLLAQVDSMIKLNWLHKLTTLSTLNLKEISRLQEISRTKRIIIISD